MAVLFVGVGGWGSCEKSTFCTLANDNQDRPHKNVAKSDSKRDNVTLVWI